MKPYVPNRYGLGGQSLRDNLMQRIMTNRQPLPSMPAVRTVQTSPVSQPQNPYYNTLRTALDSQIAQRNQLAQDKQDQITNAFRGFQQANIRNAPMEGAAQGDTAAAMNLQRLMNMKK